MTLELALASTVAVGCAAAAALLVRPTPRLARRVRPYTLVARARLGRSVDPSPGGSGLVGVVTIPLRELGATLRRRLARSSDEALALRLRQAGRSESVEEFRVRQVGLTFLLAVGGAVAGAAATRAALGVLVVGTCGGLVGVTRGRSRIERAVADRAERLRLELYTVNQLLAINLRTGAGPVQAVQRVVARGTGAVVEDLARVLHAIRSGEGERAAFERAAETTPEPAAARTYKLFAAGTERGVDLGRALLDLSEDIRDARREELRKTATRRRAAMLLPTIAVLAPVMLVFIAAPIPFIVFGPG